MRLGLLAAFLVGLALSITLAQAALAALAVRLLWRLATGRARPGGWPLAGTFAAWVAASLLAVLLSSRPLESLSAARGLLLIATFYVVLDALADRREAAGVLGSLLALGGGLGLVGSLQVLLCPALPTAAPLLGRLARNCERAHAFYSIYMTLAGVLSLVLLATLPSLLQAGPGRRWRWLAWLLGGLGLALTYVRGAWLGFLAGAVVLLGLVRRGRLLVAAGVLVLIAAIVLTPGLRRRAESIADRTDSTARERLAMWRSGLAMVRDHPLTGIGPGQVKHRYPGYAAPEFAHKRRGHLHNTPLQVAVERGLLGLGAWLALFATFFWRSARLLGRLGPEDRQARAVVVGSIAAVAGFLVGGLTEYNFGDSEVVMVAYTVMALPFVVAGRPGAPPRTPPVTTAPHRSRASGTPPA
ncbi:MAG TPA: O-antigen ligase family protein [Calidithermus sp.]|nr:O-antigen ligase family protein [Calidithermus sp.]